MPCLQQRKTDFRLTSWTRCQASSEVSSTETSSSGLMPALLKRTSMRPISLGGLRVHLADRVLVGDVGLQGQLALGALRQVDADDAGALLGEQPGRLGADPARRSGDHADLPLEASRHQPSVA